MVTRVLDTSVVAKWFLEEEGSAEAQLHLDALEEGTARVAVPSSLYFELANVLWARRNHGIEGGAAREMFVELARLPMEITDWSELLPAGLELAFELEISPYDAVFVVLARELGCDFVTADRRLWSKVYSRQPWVKLLV